VYSETSDHLDQPDHVAKTVHKVKPEVLDQLRKPEPKEPRDPQDLTVFPEHQAPKVHKDQEEKLDQ